MSALLIASIPPLLFAVVNHFDKYLVQRFFKGASVGALLIFSALIGIFIALPVALLNPESFTIPGSDMILITGNGFLYLLASLPYFYALAKDEASVVVPLFQMVPFFILLFAFVLLGESISRNNFIGGVLIVLGAVLISLELSHKKIRLKNNILWLMALSSALFALNFVVFKNFAVEHAFWVTTFWEYVGFVAFGVVMLLFVPHYRRQFFAVFKLNKTKVLAINGANEIIAVAAKSSFNFATLLMPVAVASFVSGLQPFFVFAIGTVLTLFFPKISTERIDARHMVQKIAAIVIMIFGLWVLNSANELV